MALFGRGGIGQVYRADDLALDQPVAQTFLPGGVADQDSRLAQFHNERRTARQVSHKNVVRLYELGAADGAVSPRWRRSSESLASTFWFSGSRAGQPLLDN